MLQLAHSDAFIKLGYRLQVPVSDFAFRADALAYVRDLAQSFSVGTLRTSWS